MSVILLHLIDDAGEPVPHEVREAVERAYRQLARQFTRIDGAVLAGIAESVAAKCCRRKDQIASMDHYVWTAMVGKVHEWLRAHPLVEVPVQTEEEMEALADAAEDHSLSAINNALLIAKMRTSLSTRDRQILALIEQDIDTAHGIAVELGLSYQAAKKALRRAKENMASILGTNDSTIRNSQQHQRPKWWKVLKIRRSLS